jgi:hypothetical protein
VRRPTVADLEDELSNLLHQLYRLGELCRWRLGPAGTKLSPQAFGAALAGADDLRAARAAMWTRRFDTHDLVVVAAPADLYSDFCTNMYGVLAWQPLVSLPEQTDPDGRHLDYADVLEGRAVLDTMRRAFDAMAGLPSPAAAGQRQPADHPAARQPAAGRPRRRMTPAGGGNPCRRGSVQAGEPQRRTVGRRGGMRGRRLLLAVVLLAQGCAASDPDGGAGREAGQQAQRYQGTTMVLQSPKHGPELCLGYGPFIRPPRCDGIPITNWRWDQVQGEQTADGTTWDSYQLVGTYDRRSFTVLRAQQPPPSTQPSKEQRFRDAPKPACREPADGWEVPDPAHRSDRYVDPAMEAARAEPDFAGAWVAYLEPMGGNVAEDPGEMVLNVAFTGDLARHRAQLRRLWGGAGCA